jgi:putative tryptophan/tyrosine transport system permease protein
MDLLIAALAQGALYAPMALGVFIAFRVLNTPDLTVDGSFVVGMTTCAFVAIAGHPYLALAAGMAAGALAGTVTGFLQTKLKINPILSGILTMTGLYTVNYMVLGGQSNLYLQRMAPNGSGVDVPTQSATVYKLLSFGESRELSDLGLTAVVVVAAACALAVFFKTRPGISLRATGDNEEMVRSSSINADAVRIAGIALANALVALSGALVCQQQRYADLGSGSGMLVVGLASVIIGQAFLGRGGVTLGLASAVLGSLAYRVILQLAYQIDMPTYMVKLLSAAIVTGALVLPLAKNAVVRRAK